MPSLMQREAPDLGAESIGNATGQEIPAEVLRDDLGLQHHDLLSLGEVAERAYLGYRLFDGDQQAT